MLRGKRYIILVDDEAIILSVLSLHVKSFLPEGIELITANSGESALEKLTPLLEEGGELLCVISDYMIWKYSPPQAKRLCLPVRPIYKRFQRS